jgi:recombination protein RecT
MSSAQERLDAATKQDPKTALMAQLEGKHVLEFIKKVAPELDAHGVVNVAFAHVRSTPALADCSMSSIVNAVCEAAKLGLTVDGLLGHAYMVPFKERGNPIAKMMIGYRGYEQLAYRSGMVERFHADTVCVEDAFEYWEAVQPHFRHERPRLADDRGEVIGAYATAHIRDGRFPLIAVMALSEIHARREHSSGWRAFKAKKIKSTPWDSHFEAMARKCPIRELAKRIPFPMLQGAAIRDEAREEGRPEGAVDADVTILTEEPQSGEREESNRDSRHEV